MRIGERQRQTGDKLRLEGHIGSVPESLVFRRRMTSGGGLPFLANSYKGTRAVDTEEIR